MADAGAMGKGWFGMEQMIQEILQQGIAMGGSDLFLVPGSPLRLKKKGAMLALEGEKLTPRDSEEIMQQLFDLAGRSPGKLLEEGDELVSVQETDGRQQILIATHQGQAVHFDENDVRPTGRTSMGVRGIRLKDGDFVVGAARVEEGKTVLSITERGYGKRTAVEEYRQTNRGGVGIRNYMVTEKTGPVMGIKVVDGSEDLLLVTQSGILIRTPVEAIRMAGRSTQGVIVMRFKEEGDKVIALALTDHEEAPAEGEETEEPEAPGTQAAPAPETESE